MPNAGFDVRDVKDLPEHHEEENEPSYRWNNFRFDHRRSRRL